MLFIDRGVQGDGSFYVWSNLCCLTPLTVKCVKYDDRCPLDLERTSHHQRLLKIQHFMTLFKMADAPND